MFSKVSEIMETIFGHQPADAYSVLSGLLLKCLDPLELHRVNQESL